MVESSRLVSVPPKAALLAFFPSWAQNGCWSSIHHTPRGQGPRQKGGRQGFSSSFSSGRKSVPEYLKKLSSFVSLASSSHVPSLTYKGGWGENEGTCHLKPPSWERILLARKKGLGNSCCRERKSIREGGHEEGMSRWPLQSLAQSYCQTNVGCSHY